MGNMASQTVNQVAFCPPPPTYRKRDVNMWLNTDRGDRVPAFHIRNGNPITILVSHANAEDLGHAYWDLRMLRLMLGVPFFKPQNDDSARARPPSSRVEWKRLKYSPQ